MMNYLRRCASSRSRELTPAFLAAWLLDAEGAVEEISTNVLRSFRARHPQGGAAWVLLSEMERRSHVRLSDMSDALEMHAAVFQGIRTGANDIYIVEIKATDEHGFGRVVNGLGEDAVVETDLLVPVLYGSEVQRYAVATATRVLLYPYHDSAPLSETELEQLYPRTFAYLLRYRDALASRASMIGSAKRWYELVRPRDSEWLRQPKLLIRDLAPRTAFAIDPDGQVFLVGGTAVIPERSELLMPLLAYLNSGVVNKLVRRTTPQFRGSFQKFEPQHLQKIPVLRQILEDEDFAGELAALAAAGVEACHRDDEVALQTLEAQIDEVLRQALSAQGIVAED